LTTENNNSTETVLDPAEDKVVQFKLAADNAQKERPAGPPMYTFNIETLDGETKTLEGYLFFTDGYAALSKDIDGYMIPPIPSSTFSSQAN
jgi:hypothetical protein